MSTGERPVFSDSEMRRRRAAFGEELARRELSCALVYGANRSGSGRAGVQTGELLLVTDDGPQRLHGFPPGLGQRPGLTGR